MLKQFFGNRPTTKVDCYLGVAAAVLAVIKAFDTIHQYKSEQEITKENNS